MRINELLALPSALSATIRDVAAIAGISLHVVHGILADDDATAVATLTVQIVTVPSAPA
ncbi:MAG: hypothetical protein ACXWNZ_17660 [Vulcanimicrobiaceae bacterium]